MSKVRCAMLTCATGVLLVAPVAEAQSRLVVEVEGGPIWQSYNDVRIPNDESATRFSLKDLVGSGPWSAGRVYVTWNVSGRHGLRLLAAPFSLKDAGVSGTSLRFAGATYAAGVPVRATYTFNSYRLTYRYRVRDGERITAWVGATAKVRDAQIALEQGATSSRKDDLGFVPLLHLAGEWHVGRDWRATLDGDALAGGPGRAEDVAVKLNYALGADWSVAAGYRMVEGGADVDEAYTFAWLHAAVVSLVRRW